MTEPKTKAMALLAGPEAKTAQPEAEAAQPKQAETAPPKQADGAFSADHLDFDPENPDAGAAGQADSQTQAPVVPSGCVDKEAFRQKLRSYFDLAGALPGPPPLPLKSMTVQPHELEGCYALADELHALAIRYPWLRFIISDDLSFLDRYILIGSFVMGKAGAVMAELDSRKPKPEPVPDTVQADASGPAKRRTVKATVPAKPAREMPEEVQAA